MLFVHPYSLKAVDVPDGLVDRYREAGFKEQEPEAVEPSKDSAPTRRRRTSK
jgi:hypothetical protein